MRRILITLLLALASPSSLSATKLDDFFRRSTHRLADACLNDVKTLADWQRHRPELRRQLLYMLGLDPLPEKTDLHATVTGAVDGGTFVVEKLHFQSRPGLYVTANFYRPKDIDKPLPTILYLCGHSPVKRDGVSYGAKAAYQHHAAWFARHGYCCLVLDTLQLGEIEGIHHGTYREKMWWWISRGYTPAGVEAWNAVRAIDYLESRPEVNWTKIGVTGRSGGGASTWWLAAIDDRPACFVPVAGMTDLENHVVDGCIEGHCDCMYMVNTYGWDFAAVAALAAPRPVLFSNTDKDKIFPLDGVVRTHAKLKRIYQLHNAADKLGLLITEGPHNDTQDLQVPAFRWLNRWLKGSDEPITDAAVSPFDPKQLKVFAELPADQKNTTAHEWFVPAAMVPLPASKDEWEKQREKLMIELTEKCFAQRVYFLMGDVLKGVPSQRGVAVANVETDLNPISDKVMDKLHLQTFTLPSSTEEELRIPVYVVRAAGRARSERLVIKPLDTAAWKSWLATMAPAFAGDLPGGKDAEPNHAAFQALVKRLNDEDCALAILPPTGEGPNAWDVKLDTHIRRRFALLGRTVDDVEVRDTGRAIAMLRRLPVFKDAKVTMEGDGRMAAIALYAGLFEPSVERFELTNLPPSHRNGPTFLNVLRVLDMPQAVALTFPRAVTLYDGDAKDWTWTTSVAKLYGDKSPLQFRKSSKRE